MSTDDPRPALIGRCVDCRTPDLEPLDAGWRCRACERRYEYSAGGVLQAMPSAGLARLPAFYRTAFYRRWMAAWEDMISDWVIYSNRFYKFFSMSGHRTVSRLLQKVAGNEGVVVDLGCGAGRLFEVVEHPHPVGVDSNLAFLELMKQRYPHVMAIQADIANTPFLPGSIRTVVSLHTIEHLYFLAESLEEIHRLLPDDGRLIFSIPTEGGFGWSLGRTLVTGPRLRRRYDLDVERVMAIEHINDARRILRFVRFYFAIERLRYSPFPFLPFLGVNSSITGVASALSKDSEHWPEIDA